MYPLEWIERRKDRGEKRDAAIAPVVWKLGYTSLLTDISSEMVNSLLPVYLVLHLHLSTAQYGAIDGIYNGFALALLSLAGGLVSDRTRRPREVAALGYSLSALCKLLLLAVGSGWGLIASVIAIDRAGKGIRTAPRDAIISLCNPSASLASAFAVHRGLDAGGALLGPIVAFLLINQLPGAFDAVWLTGFVFAFLGLAVLWLFVANPPRTSQSSHPAFSWRKISSAVSGRGFWSLAMIAGLLAVATMSDGFVYLLLQRRTNFNVGFFPLFYVATACGYMLLSLPLGRIADRNGHMPIFISGYVAVAAIYVLLLASNLSGLYLCVACLLLLGFYYAATQGVLMAMAAGLIPPEYRSSGLAVLATVIGLGKLLSSIFFGWMWQAFGAQQAVLFFLCALVLAAAFAVPWLRRSLHANAAR